MSQAADAAGTVGMVMMMPPFLNSMVMLHMLGAAFLSTWRGEARKGLAGRVSGGSRRTGHRKGREEEPSRGESAKAKVRPSHGLRWGQALLGRAP